MDYLDKPDPQTFIAHHGIKGQKWGVRRFQNADGSLTKAGKERYNEQNSSDSSDNHENQKFHLTEKQKKYCKTVAKLLRLPQEPHWSLMLVLSLQIVVN
jgi:hypothetical protein